ncbi:hypothetical protein ZIOFF_037901 [Zingiber officinale]|uniref:Ribosomal protein L25 beta domain-containing protein n=1 Tax=Zingiber officinale TaxID=94328 RepID=A0A8J5L4G3_ZINOF|nr:hypothetical protein ZIOFF_037901 [Zingiber officinale]
MLLRRSPETLRVGILRLRYFSNSAAATIPQHEPAPIEPLPRLEYLEGFPRPDPKHSETITAIPRDKSGKNISSKERKAGRVPSIVFEQEDGQHGGNKRLISVQTKQIRKLVDHLGRSFFLSRLFELEVLSEFGDSGDIIEKVRVLPRKLHLHSATDEPLNVTFVRAPSSALLKIDVPLIFRGEDASPGLRKVNGCRCICTGQTWEFILAVLMLSLACLHRLLLVAKESFGTTVNLSLFDLMATSAYLNTINRTVKYLCPADIIPPYIDVDLSELDVGQKLIMRDLKVHPALRLLQSPDQPICNIIGSRGARESKKSK